MKHARIALTIAAAALLAGCALSPEQLAASAKAKDANVACARYASLPVDVTITYVNVDKGVVGNGGITVTKECDVTFANGSRP